MLLRPIEKDDNAEVAALIRKSLEQENLAIPGTAYFDPQLDNLTDYYASLDRAAYFVLEEDGAIVGAGGFAPVTSEIAELQKLYVDSSQRGKGLSSVLLRAIFDKAKAAGYKQLYLETANELAAAIAVYEHFGFVSLDQPLATDAGHTAMTIWMIKTL